MYQIALWGLSEGYNEFTSLHGHEQARVVAVADHERKCIRKVDGIPVISPAELLDTSFDYLIICDADNQKYQKTADEAVHLGISRDIILPLRIFRIPFFNFDDYVRIRQSNVSILSDYCFAGYLYHKFGMQFTSPTIRMFTSNDHYYRFLKNLDYYLEEPMTEVTDVVDQPHMGILSYPRGRVGDVEWAFNHDVTFETAADRWNRGVQRFNRDNFIAIMVIRSDRMAHAFHELPLKHKIGFYWKELHLDSVVCMPEWNDPKVRARLGYDFCSMVNRAADDDNGFRSINWMKALLHHEGFKRVE